MRKGKQNWCALGSKLRIGGVLSLSTEEKRRKDTSVTRSEVGAKGGRKRMRAEGEGGTNERKNKDVTSDE